MRREDFPAPTEGVVLTVLLIVEDIDRSRDFYRDVLGAEVVMERDPAILKFHNSWLIINVGGGPTADKPDVVLTAPQNPQLASSAINLRVADIASVYRSGRLAGRTSSPLRSTSGARSAPISGTLTGTSSRLASPPARWR